jgi:cobalt-precorrin-5B (C1)-methyltransferase
LLLLKKQQSAQVEIPFPGGERHSFLLHTCERQEGGATASVIKDAGDDPDVTNGAEVIVSVRKLELKEGEETVVLRAGAGVGTVTKAGLPVAVGEPAINPIPRRMILEAVAEVTEWQNKPVRLAVTVSVRNGEQLAEQTLNKRLGILGGLSILGTTGIVRPVSVKAWTDTIDASMKVARAAGLDQVILSTGRTSEAAVQKILLLPEEAQVMMGDYLAYALTAAQRHGFRRIHLAGMWAKILKCALCIPQTHVRNGALEMKQAACLLGELGLDRENVIRMAAANTAREILQSSMQSNAPAYRWIFIS